MVCLKKKSPSQVWLFLKQQSLKLGCVLDNGREHKNLSVFFTSGSTPQRDEGAELTENLNPPLPPPSGPQQRAS